ncbi:MAG: DUF2624 family protein [Synergistaceae bacterium]|nr:DUF2624 family protein [Synergistaceae bacterium]
MMTFTKEQIRKAMNCKTVDELLALANSEGVELSREQAEEYIAQLGKRKLTNEELDKVAGGDGCGGVNCVVCEGVCRKDK